MEKLDFTIVSPEKIFFEDSVDMVVIPGDSGDFGVLPKHAAMISSLKPGFIRIYDQNKVVNQIFISGGFANVNENECTILAEDCQFYEELKIDDLEGTLTRIEQEIVIARSEDEKERLKKYLNVTNTKLDLFKKISEINSHK